MLRAKHLRNVSVSAARAVAFAFLAFTQVVAAVPLTSRKSGPASAPPQPEKVQVETNPRIVSPRGIAVNVASAPSMTAKKNQEYEVRWEVPRSGLWFIAINKRLAADSGPGNSWVDCKKWGASQPSEAARFLSKDLGPDGKCVITVWYDSPDIDKGKAGQLTAMPYSGLTQAIITSQGKRLQQFVFEFKLSADQPVIAKVIVTRPA